MRLTGRQGCLSVLFILPCLLSPGDRWASLPWHSLPLSPVGLTRTADGLSVSLFLSLTLALSLLLALSPMDTHGCTHTYTDTLTHTMSLTLSPVTSHRRHASLMQSHKYGHRPGHMLCHTGGSKRSRGWGGGVLEADPFTEHII